jgi:hypothetical protein
MLLPYGISVIVSGRRTKPVKCAFCGSCYSYEMIRAAQGMQVSGFGLFERFASKSARRLAASNLEHLLATDSDFIPCPNCFQYQPNMLKRDQSAIAKTTVGVLTVAYTTTYLLQVTWAPMMQDTPRIAFWYPSAALTAILLAVGYARSIRRHDSSRRKAQSDFGTTISEMDWERLTDAEMQLDSDRPGESFWNIDIRRQLRCRRRKT